MGIPYTYIRNRNKYTDAYTHRANACMLHFFLNTPITNGGVALEGLYYARMITRKKIKKITHCAYGGVAFEGFYKALAAN